MSPALAQRIAAGEVVERPGSVLRELVENALDAGARSIRATVAGAGLDLIEVSDDGQGIAPDELALAFSRHATSKILSEHDLDAIQTLGFRGEALSAIAAVATVEATSATSSGQAGARIVLREGEVREEGRRARAPGTTIRVLDLFAGLPVRRSFLPNPRAERAHLLSLIRLYALARPMVRFSLTVDGKEVFHCAGLGEPSALAAVYADQAARLTPLGTHTLSQGQVHGYLGDPGLTRGNRDGLSLVLNGRWIRPKGWLSALESAYQAILPHGRHPVTALYIDIDPSLVDVNLHPAKLEVRVRGDEEWRMELGALIRERLGNSLTPAALLANPLDRPRQRTLPTPRRSLREGGPDYGEELNFASMRVLGQVFHTAILAEAGNILYLVDQHRADERALYEVLATQENVVASQELLEPIRFEAKDRDLEAIEARLPELAVLGFRVERFGRRTFLVRSQPTGLPEGTAAALRESLAGSVDEGPNWRERLVVDLACRAAIKRGTALTDQEMLTILARLQRCASRTQCPHGSPIVAVVRAEDLARHFKWP
jgi:DNA mismatch repair protein MutL